MPHTPNDPGIERQRLSDEKLRKPGANWKRWGPYLAERQWGTVREAEPGVLPWESFPHSLARSRAYRWGEDGLLGITDRQCRLAFALAFWNGQDEILKERLFGVSGPEGNHGEDVKECYFYLDSTPTHSYMKALYKYPQSRFPYDDIREENLRRSREDPEYELIDTGIFDEDRYFDVFIEYAKAAPEDILIQITIHNRGPEDAYLDVLPQLWFRNTWTRTTKFEQDWARPSIDHDASSDSVLADHETLGRMRLFADVDPQGARPAWLFTENETNTWRMEDPRSNRPSCKDAFHLAVVKGIESAVNPRPSGTKAAARYTMRVASENAIVLRLRLVDDSIATDDPFNELFARTLEERRAQADAFYNALAPHGLSEDQRRVHRQSCAGVLWTKQFYSYSVSDWLTDNTQGDKGRAEPVRNADWAHLYNRDVISMPDKWEYPWYAAWDSAFHMIPFAKLDPDYAKAQLLLFLREWYQHPNGQIPAYEWNFGDVNPPVHAWACWRIYQLTKRDGEADTEFLERVFQKLLLNFTWWVNRKDVRGFHVFSGGFLGLDNIGIFDRSKPLPTGGHLEQADGTAWMAFYCASMLSIAMELAATNSAYSDMASKFFEHYIAIAEAMNSLDGCGLWDDEDGFYYDHLHVSGQSIPLRIRSMVGVIPLFTVDVLHDSILKQLPGFQRRLDWFYRRTHFLSESMTFMETSTRDDGEVLRLMAVPTRARLEKILRYVLDEDEFLSPFGVRSLSKYHQEHPFEFQVGDQQLVVSYVPGESNSAMFGGNSNWRGPVWFPLNYLLIEACERYHHFYGDDLRVECPTGSGNYLNLQQVADEIRCRLAKLFEQCENGTRPCYARGERFANDPHWRDLVLFYEYFHGDTGRGMGASHQTGWTALVAPILERMAEMK